MKTTSRFALAAAAGLFVGAMAFTPAKAADLGGDCCADLEERVAELEATTVRKGNRVVSVELYGQVNKVLMFWDDGIESDVYVADSDISSTRFGLRGSASLKPGWTAGYRIEIQMESASSISNSQDYEDLPGDDSGTDISVRRTSLYVESARLGRVTMGKTSIATDDLVYTYLGAVNVTGAEFVGGGLRLRHGDGDFVGGAGGDPDLNAVSISTVATDTDIGRKDAIRYDTPSIYGFILSAGWGESDVADISLRFRKEWNSIQVVAAAGYRWDGDNDKDDIDNDAIDQVDTETLILAGGIKHTPSGLFLNGVWVQQDRDDLVEALEFDNGGDFSEVDETATYYSIFGGIERNWTGYGLTSFFGRYTMYEDFGTGTLADWNTAGAVDEILATSEVSVYGFGIEQNFDSAAMEVYLHFNYFEFDDFAEVEDDGTGLTDVDDIEDVWVTYLGTRIRF
jgi:predicted porin